MLVIQDGDYGQPWKTIGTGVGASTAVAGDAALSALETTRCSTVEGVYSAMTTMTTVRYGDPAPDAGGGKALASGL